MNAVGVQPHCSATKALPSGGKQVKNRTGTDVDATTLSTRASSVQGGARPQQLTCNARPYPKPWAHRTSSYVIGRSRSSFEEVAVSSILVYLLLCNNKMDQPTTAVASIVPNPSNGNACGHHVATRAFARLVTADVARVDA